MDGFQLPEAYRVALWSLFMFYTKSPGVSGTQLIDLRTMKG